VAGKGERAVPGSPAIDAFWRAFSSLRLYNYRLYWFGQVVSLTGTWMQRLAQAWLVLKLTNSPLALGTVTTLQFLPITLFSLFGGVVADRMPKRRLLIVTQSVAAIQAVLLASLTALGLIRLWEIYILASLLGLANAFDNPARQSFPVELVGREEVANAVALNSTLANTSRIVGPSLGGIAIAAVGVTGCFWLNAVSFLSMILGLTAMRPGQFYAPPRRARASTAHLLREGIGYAFRTPAVCVLFLALLFFGTFAFNFNVLLPLLARYTLGAGSLGYGFLFTSFGAGSLVAALGLAYTRAQSTRAVFIGGATLAAMLVALGFSRIYFVTALLLAATGASSILYSASTQTRLQLIVPDELRGRTMSIYTLLFQGTTPIGSILLGALAERWNPQAAVVILGCLSASGLAAVWLYLRGRSADDMLRGTLLAEAPLYAIAPPGAGLSLQADAAPRVGGD
jgi:MFS family permease